MAVVDSKYYQLKLQKSFDYLSTVIESANFSGESYLVLSVISKTWTYSLLVRRLTIANKYDIANVRDTTAFNIIQTFSSEENLNRVWIGEIG